MDTPLRILMVTSSDEEAALLTAVLAATGIPIEATRSALPDPLSAPPESLPDVDVVLLGPGAAADTARWVGRADSGERWFAVVAVVGGGKLAQSVVSLKSGVTEPIPFDELSAARLRGALQIAQQRVSDELTRAAFLDAMPGPVWVADPEGAVVWANQPWCDYFGRRPPVQGWTDLVAPEDVDAGRAVFHAPPDRGRPTDLDLRMVRHDGVLRWNVVRARPLVDSRGNRRGWVGSNTDVHDRHLRTDAFAFLAKASDRLSEPLERETQARQAVELAVPELAEACRLDLTNHGVLACLGEAHVDEARRTPLRAFDSDTTAQTALMAAARGQEQIVRRDTAEPSFARLLDRLGVRTCVLLPLHVRDESLGVLSLFHADERRLDEETGLPLARSFARRVAVALESGQLYARALEGQRRVALLQALTAGLSGALTPEEVVDVAIGRTRELLGAGTLALRLVGDDGRARLVRHSGIDPGWSSRFQTVAPGDDTPMSRALGTGRPVFVGSLRQLAEEFPAVGETSAFLRDATTGLPERAGASLPLVGRRGVLGILSVAFMAERSFEPDERAELQSVATLLAEALERARLFEAERTARDEQQRRADFEEQFVAIVSHDLRGPLGAITTTAEVLLRGAPEERVASAARRIVSSARRMARLIADLLDFTRLRVGSGIPVLRARCDLGALVEDIVQEARAQHPDRHVQFVRRGDLVGTWDGSRLAQVFANLLSNAITHGARDELVEVTLDGTGDRVVARVHNGGPPIPSDRFAHIFEPYRRVDEGAAREGLGLGLYIVERVIAAHGGTITVHSARGEGTDFTVELPR